MHRAIRGVTERGINEISAEFQEKSDKPTKTDTQAISIFRFAQHIETPLASHIPVVVYPWGMVFASNTWAIYVMLPVKST